VIVRIFERRDIGQVLTIQVASLEIAQWTPADYDLAGQAGMRGWVVEEEKRIIGFLVARNVLEEAEILNLAVQPESRRRGSGSLLLSEALNCFAHAGVRKTFLEVRESNAAAIAFYERHNFRITSRRLRYYRAPLEDALVLTRAEDA
jgi:ribosomal-protein-alanine N-acetyltransferase